MCKNLPNFGGKTRFYMEVQHLQEDNKNNWAINYKKRPIINEKDNFPTSKNLIITQDFLVAFSLTTRQSYS